MSNQSTLSPAEYAKVTGLQALLSKAVNDCYLTQSPCPAATMSNLLRATYSLDTFSDISISEVCDGDGSGFSAEVTLSLTSGQKASTLVSHSNNTVPFHPNTSGRKIALLPKELLTATGPNSLQALLLPPPPPPPTLKKGGAADGPSSTGKGQPPPSGNALGDVDPHSLATSAALAKATRFRLTSSIAYFNNNVRNNLMPLRAVAQHSIDRTLLGSDPNGPFEHLLGQVAAGVSLACAKVAAAALNKPLALYIGGLYHDICGREYNNGVTYDDLPSPAGIANNTNNNNGSLTSSYAPHYSLNSTVAGGLTNLTNVVSPNGARNGTINTTSYAIPNLVVTLFSTDPRGMGKVRIREVCLVVHVQNTNTPEGNTHTSNRLTMDSVAAMHKIVEVATSKAAAIASAACGVSAAEVESTMMSVMPDGSIRFPFFESPQQMIDVVEQSIREVVGGAVGASNNQAGSSNNNGGLREFSVGLVVDGGLCYRTPSGKYSFVNGEPELSGALLSEQLATLAGCGVASNAASSTTAPPPPSNTHQHGALTYIEDSHIDTDIEAMQRLAYRVGAREGMILAGNHLYGSNATALVQGSSLMLTNSAILRMSDVGRLTTLLENARRFRVSRVGGSVGLIGETSEGDGAALAHVAIGVHARVLRVGGLLRREHAAVVNELLRMSQHLEKCGLLAKIAATFDNKRMAMPSAPVEVAVAEVVAPPPKKGKK